MKCDPLILSSPSDAGKVIRSVESKIGDEKTEAWLQNLIFQHPTLLPVDYFDEAFSPLIPIVKELATPSGYVDNLFVSPFGRVTIVETKLWKNPEKHRTVVAQIIDYAKDISGWSYEELNGAILKASREGDSSVKQPLDQLAEPFLKDAGLTLTDFQERVIASLANGEFLLLIVGDKISPNVALLSEAVHGAPGLDFRLGLVELHLYPLAEGKNWPLLVIPDIVGTTVEKTRGVIQVQYVREQPKVTVDISREEMGPKPKVTAETFLQKTPDDLRPIYEQWIEVWAKKNLTIYWGTVGFSLRVIAHSKLETVIDAYPEWAVALIRESDAKRCGASENQYRQYVDNIGGVPNAVNLISADKKYIKHDSIRAEDLMTILKATTEFAEGFSQQGEI